MRVARPFTFLTLLLLPLLNVSVAQAMELSDFVPMIKNRATPHPYYEVNALYAARDLSGSIFVRRGLPESPALLALVKKAWVPTMTKQGPGLVHYRTEKNHTVSLYYFHEIEAGDAVKLAQEVAKATPSLPTTSRRFSFINEAHAEVLNCGTDPGINANGANTGLAGIENLSSEVEGHETQAMIMSCLSGVVSGATDATWGAVKGLAEGLYTLVTDPMKVAESLGKMWDGMKAFVLDFKNQVSQMISTIAALPGPQKSEILCSFIGGIGTGALIAFLTGGGGLGPLAGKLTMYVARILKMKDLLLFLNKMKGWANKLPKGFFTRMAKGDIPDQYIDDVTLLHRMEPNLSLEALQCGI